GATGAARGATRASAVAAGVARELHRRPLRDRMAALPEAEPPRSESGPDPGGTPPLRRSGLPLAPLTPPRGAYARTWSDAGAAGGASFAPPPPPPIQAGVSVAARTARLRALLAERIVVLDGATGTYLQGRDLGPADFGGERYEGCNEHLVLTRPDVVRDMHAGYLAAGADIVETNTFGGTRIVLAEYGLEGKVREINATAARLPRDTVARFETPDHPRFVAGSMGPGTKTISVTGGGPLDTVCAAYAQQTPRLPPGGAAPPLPPTPQAPLNVKAPPPALP